MTRRTKNCAGYSMVELLTVLAVLTGILAMALPSMADFLAAMRLRSGADAMLTSLNLARSAAVQRSVRVALCRSTNGISCSESEDWNAGWLVFQDTNNSGTLDEGEALIYRQNALPGHLQLTGNVTVNTYVSYTPFGQAKLLKGGFQAGTFTICSNEVGRKDGYKVFVASSGRARLAKAPDICQ